MEYWCFNYLGGKSGHGVLSKRVVLFSFLTYVNRDISTEWSVYMGYIDLFRCYCYSEKVYNMSGWFHLRTCRVVSTSSRNQGQILLDQAPINFIILPLPYKRLAKSTAPSLSPSGLCFLLLRMIYEYYEARIVISLFQMYELFSQRFRVFKLEYSIHATYAIQLCLPIFLTSTYVTTDTIWSYVQTNLFTNDESTA